ncbi:ankyrin repeat domain-containing protein [Sphingomonas sp. QA11]|uniref:ankyrin repeat domain-containing protein n=1 Tax=Sphingomonas sp. QA11 TaxID=2950605 RepID=UPI0023493409|nr:MULTISPECIES: ankyrin repeat domain-containing protein [unclassified Sphingomonas]WCM26516.1 ankyrin repeat domain-containing protein [Sphingomonas sp. QA11]WEJ98953.1 MAG: ankyrin repeat domain-containing protein [Sphingomonas sp.]
MIARTFGIALTAALLGATAIPVQAQNQSEGYKFLQAVKDAKGSDVEKMLRVPGTTVLNTREYATGEGALHIVVKRGDGTYLRYLLAQGADPNIKDDKGNTPLLVAAGLGQIDLMQVLIEKNANVNLANSSGETPLIRAVQRRDLGMARTLLAAGGDPDQADVIAGKSARDYAVEDARSTAMAKLMAETPKKARRAISGPTLR